MFSMDVGWRMLFDFNVLLSNGSDWSPTNARKLLQYTAHRNYATNIDFELGNGMQIEFRSIYIRY